MSNKKRITPMQHQELALKLKSASPYLHLPKLYRTYLLNDDYTPMDFVVEVLERYFSMSHHSATETMLQVHQQGRGVCGQFTKEIAEMKVVQVNEYAKRNQHPLLCRMEESGA